MKNVQFRGRNYLLANPDSVPGSPKEDFVPDFPRGPSFGPPGDEPVVKKQDSMASSPSLAFPREEEDFSHGPPKDYPVTHHREYIASNEGPGPTPPPVCIPPDPAGSIFQTGGSEPLQLGENVVFSEDGSTGITGPVTWQWSLNGTPTVTTSTYAYTVSDGDIHDKNAEGIGFITISVTVTNPCGEETYTSNYPAQGTIPP